MKYFIDTEFIEGSQTKRLLSIPIGKTKPTIDLISIGIVAKDNRQYYAISKDFNLKEAWNRYDLKTRSDSGGNTFTYKDYWIRDNVLKPIFKELWYEKCHLQNLHHCSNDFTYKNLKTLINLYGKTNKQIADEVKIFVANRGDNKTEQWILEYEYNKDKPEFYGYYADYDWVVFCWLFGRMIELPKGFPMYCRDLKQIADEIWKTTGKNTKFNSPKGEHNALQDAYWNKKLYEFLNDL